VSGRLTVKLSNKLSNDVLRCDSHSPIQRTLSWMAGQFEVALGISILTAIPLGAWGLMHGGRAHH
jgi:hypothetical protein